MFKEVFEGQRVLVTGHTGFKGSWLTKWLLMQGASVYGYSLDPAPDATLYDQLELSNELQQDVRACITDAHRIKSYIENIQPRFVFHLAAQPLVRASYETPRETFETNVLGTVNLLDALRNLETACSTVIVTTDKCYENREWVHGYREEDALGGRDPYSASKAAAEIVTASYRDSFFQNGKTRVATGRAGNVIGGGDWATDRIIPDFVRSVRCGKPVKIRNPHSTRPWQHVLEPLSGYLVLASKLDASINRCVSAKPDSAFNFGPTLESNRSVIQLIESMSRQFPGSDWEDRSNGSEVHEASRLDLSIAKAYHQLDWTPVWSFSETVTETATWYQRESTGTEMKSFTENQIQKYTSDAFRKRLPWASRQRQPRQFDNDAIRAA